METRRELRQAARELMKSESVAPSKAIVDLLDEEPLEVEIATTLLYEHCHYSYRQIRHSHGYWWIPGHAPSPALHPADAGIHHAPRLRNAARCGRCRSAPSLSDR